MKYVKNQNGFTLIEVIVTINLAFLVVASVVSFYLMVNKIFAGSIKRAEDKHIVNDFFYKLNESLNKAECYSLQLCDSSSQLLTGGDTVFFSPGKISGSSIMRQDNIGNYEVDIFFISGNSIKISNGIAKGIFMPGEYNVIVSDTINSISLKLEKNKVYSCSIYNKPIAYKRFKNL